MKKLVYIFFLHIYLFASPQQCELSYDIMYAIADVERHPKRDVGYPYIISLNKKSDIDKLYGDYKDLFMDKRSIDCYNTQTCVDVASTLIDDGIDNLDLGAFQVNYRYHKMELEKYFVLSHSYNKACDILMSLKKSYGWSWDTIGKYHSFRKKLYTKYASKVYASVNRR